MPRTKKAPGQKKSGKTGGKIQDYTGAEASQNSTAIDLEDSLEVEKHENFLTVENNSTDARAAPMEFSQQQVSMENSQGIALANVAQATGDMEVKIIDESISINENLDHPIRTDDLPMETSQQPVSMEFSQQQIAMECSQKLSSVECSQDSLETNAREFKSEDEPKQDEIGAATLVKKKEYETSCSKHFTGSPIEKENRLKARICFIPAIPYSQTEFWKEEEQVVYGDYDKLDIFGGRLIYTITNISGPAISLDLYKFYDMRHDEPLEILSSSTVRERWTVYDSSLPCKFKIIPRLEKFTLESRQSVSFDSRHRKAEILIARAKDRKHVPCYFAVLRGLVSTSTIQITLFNSIEYSIIDMNLDKGENLLDDSLKAMIASWGDDDEFE